MGGAGIFREEDLVGALAEAFENEGFFGGDERLEAEQERRAMREPFQVEQAQGQQTLCFARCDLVILEGGGQIQKDLRMTNHRRALQQMHDLISSEGAPQVDAIRCFQHTKAALADLARDAVGGKAVPAVQHRDGSAQAEFCEQDGEKCRSAEGNGDFAGFESGEDVHADTIHGVTEIKNPLTGISWGNTLGEAGVG